MKQLLLLLLTVSWLSQAETTSAPDFAIHTPEHQTNLQQLAQSGHVIYVDFWASWCGPCRKSFPWLNEIQQTYAEQGLIVIAINVDMDRTKADEFLSRYPADFPIVFDPQGAIASQYNLLGMPSSFLIDSNGHLVSQHHGFIPAKTAEYEQQIRQQLNLLSAQLTEH